MCCWLILEYVGPEIQHIAGVDNIVMGILRRLKYATNEQDNISNRRVKCCENESFAAN